MGNSVSVDAVSPPLEYASEEANNIPFEPYGNDPVLGSFGTAMRVRPKPGQFIGIEMAVSKTIRVMNSNPSHLEDDKDRIREKVAQLSRERHPHMLKTIATYFYNDYNGVQFTIVVEFAGENLEAYLPPWPSKAASKPPRPQWFGCLMGAVAYLHRHGIRHGNITPESILVRNSKTVLLSNLDMSEVDAWRTQQTTINMKSGRWRMTACGRYGAPEAGQEQEVGVRRGRAADIFSLGAVFVEMVLANCNDRQELGPALESVLRSQNSTAKSYAYRVYAVDNWLADLTMSSSPSQGWETEVLSFCRDMLDPEPDARPRADELSSRWKTVVVAHPQLRHATCNECEVSGDDMTRTTMTADADAYLDSTDDSGETDLFRAAG
jgi:serine/threonine protein kinase